MENSYVLQVYMRYNKDKRNLGNDFHGKKREIVRI